MAEEDGVKRGEPPELEGAEEGRLVAGRYRLRGRLGQGGMGLTFIADDEKERGLIENSAGYVLKLLAPALIAASPEHKKRFLHTAALQSRLAIPGVAVARDFGEDGALAYLVMPYDPERRPLRALIEEAPGRVLGWRDAAAILRSVAETLVLLHDRKVLHRDLKPSNILARRSADGRWETLLIDFGIAKDLEAKESHTGTGQTPGFTPQYGAPELLRSSGEPRSDLFSLGVTALELLTGRCYHGKGPNDLEGPRVPGRLHRLIRAMTDTDPEARPASARAVLAELDRLAERPWLTWAVAALAAGLAAAALLLGGRELERLSGQVREVLRQKAGVEAELRLALERRERAPPTEAAPPATPAPDPTAAALARYEALAAAEEQLWKAADPPAELVEKQREAWADLEQRGGSRALCEAARGRKLLHDGLALRRRYRVALRRLRKPFDPGPNPLSVEFGEGAQRVRLAGLTAAAREGVATVALPEDGPALTAELPGRGELAFKLTEERPWAFDRDILDEAIVLRIPPDPRLLSDGIELTLAGKDGLEVVLHIRRE